LGLLPCAVLGQEETPPTEAAAEAEQQSQEVEISEDNYRRFMELRDPRITRPAMPVMQSAPADGLEKMDSLPEASRRHLRDQLREIILASDPWTPENAGELYPFEPSEEARLDPELRGLENEAWKELVGKYHEREAELYAQRQRGGMNGDTNGGETAAQARQEAGPGQGRAGQAGGRQAGEGQEGQGQQGRGQQGQGQEGQAGQSADGTVSAEELARSAAARAAGRSSVDSPVRNPRPESEGATESALEFLTGAAGRSGEGTPVRNAEEASGGRSVTVGIGTGTDPASTRGLLTLDELETVRGIGGGAAGEPVNQDEGGKEDEDG
jgi:hypothetical protein